ncbi:MAG: hypothetical protein ACE5G8_03400, partial [Anaerolineae bacterium]
TITTITLWGDDYFGSNALLYMGQGNFLLADCGQGGNDSCASPWFSGLYRLSTGGAAIFLAQLDHLSKGLAPGADLSLRLRDSVDPLLMGAGTPLTYTVMVTNAGFLDAAGVVLTGALPSGAEVNVRQAGSWACAAGGNHFTCTLPSLATGATATVTLAATPTAVGTLTHTVGVTAATPDPNPANSWAAEVTAVTSKDLSITKQDSGDPATVGQPLTYTIIIANHGPGAMTGLVMTDTLPPAVLFNAWASDRFACLETGGVVNCNLGALAEGASSVITIVVTPTLTTTIVNTAAVRGSEFEADRANNTAVETTVIWEGEARVYLPLIVKEL